MPPERRTLAPPPRTPLAIAIPTSSRRTSITATIPIQSSSSSSRSLAGTSSLIHPPDSYMSSYLSNRHAKGTMLNKVYIHQRSISKQEQLRFELQKRHHQSQQQFNQLKIVQQEFHRQREVYHQQQVQARQQRQQHHHHYHHYHVLPPSTDSAASTVSTSSPYSSSSTIIPTDPLPPPLRHSQYSEWVAVREKERARLQSSSSSSSSLTPPFSFSNISSTIAPPPMMPLPPQIARDNLRRLSERLRRRRARARETILYDLHQGVKSVEAQVHRQVEMVLSRLKEAPGSRYAFALTNSLLSQIPIAASLLPSLPSVGDGPSQVENPEDQKRIQERERHRAAAESLSNEFDSIALAGRPDRYIDSPPASSISPSSSSSQPEGEHQVSISRSGASEFLSASMHTSYSTAASQVLSAALPSFIPSMVAPLVCVFSYPAPSSSSLTMNPGDPESAQQQQQQKDFVFPWGLPNRPPPPYHSPLLRRVQTGQTEERLQQQQGHPPMSTTNSGIDVVHSKFWTQAEREALHLAATRFRLAGQWSKIREMMNLHRTDEEIEGEYVKLYGHRTGIKDYDEDEDDEIENQSGRDENRRKKGDRMEEDRFGSMDGDADDEAEFGGGTLFVKLGGSRRSMASHPHPHPPPPPPHYHHLQQPQQQQQRQLQQQQVQESSSTGALRTGYELQPIVDSQQRLVVIHEPTWMHKNDHMTDKQFALEEIPMRL